MLIRLSYVLSPLSESTLISLFININNSLDQRIIVSHALARKTSFVVVNLEMKLLSEQVFGIHQLDVMLVYLYYSLYLLLTAIILLQLQLILQGQNLPLFSALLLLLLLLVITAQLIIIGWIFLEIVFLQPSSNIIIQTLLDNISLHTQENTVLLKLNLFFSISDFVDYFSHSNQLLLSEFDLMGIRFA